MKFSTKEIEDLILIQRAVPGTAVPPDFFNVVSQLLEQVRIMKQALMDIGFGAPEEYRDDARIEAGWLMNYARETLAKIDGDGE